MKMELAYGESTVEMDFSGAESVQVLQGKALTPIENLQDAFYSAVTQECVESPALKELVVSGDQVTIVVSDITRYWMRQDKIVALLVEYLAEEVGVAYEDMAVVIALGTHRAQTEEELKKLVTPAVYEKVRVLNHDCMASNLTKVGTTSRGTEVWVNPLAVGRKLIVIGGTVHHLMAGFGGGRKNILPGIAGKTTINQNHIHSLSPTMPKSNPLIGVGRLAENPVNEDMDEACAMVNPTFGINIIADSKSRHCALICGHWRKAWEQSCRVVADSMGVTIPQKADVVVVSCGGFPRDISLYQGVKSLLNASRAVMDGGDIVFLAECREGGGADEYFSWIKPLRRGTLDADLRADFSIAGYIFYASVEAVANCSCHMLTEIPPETIAPMGLSAYSDISELLRQVDFSGKSVYVMPYGGGTVPFLESEKNNS